MTLTLVIAMSLTATDPAAYEKDLDGWHDKRLLRLTAEDGWLSVVGLHWLDEGANTVDDLGTFTRKGKSVEFAPALDVTLDGTPFKGGAVKTDGGGNPDVFRAGSRRFMVLERGGRMGVRVRDAAAKARKEFKGIPRYPVSLAWKKEARFIPAEKGKMLAVPNVLGDVSEVEVAGTAAFTHDGQEQKLIATWEDGKLFFVFGDLTNKTATYGAGRFLYANAPKDGKAVLDFNKALNPPCAFTPHATCPLPVRENKLTISIEAGEKRPHDAH